MAKKQKAKASKPTGTIDFRKDERPAEMDDDQVQVLFFHHRDAYVTALAKKKKADADFKNICKLAKSDLKTTGMSDAVARIKLAILLETDGGDAELRERFENELRVARWMGASVGSQFEMWGDPDRTPAVDRAFADGKRAGLAGAPCKPDYAPETEQYASYMSGFHEGQEVLAQGIKSPLGEEMSAASDSLAQTH